MRTWVLGVVALAACGRDTGGSLAGVIAEGAAKLPGLQVVIEQRGERIVDGSYGFADLEHRVPVTGDTVFAIGSISKQFGAAAVLQLVEAGLLSLEDPLAKFYPAYPRGDRIRVRDLLRHTSGIEDFEYTGPWPATMAVARSDDEVIATFRDRPPLFEPNRGWAYSTSNYVLLGKIVEQVARLPLRDYLRDRVFAPASLESTRFCDADELIPDRARGYDRVAGKFVPAKMAILTQFGIGGGLCSTARDLMAWQKALESGRVVSAEAYRQMMTPEPLADGTPTGYGFGLASSVIGGHRAIGHSGGVSGFGAFEIVFPDDDLRIVELVNGRMGGPALLAAKHLLGIGSATPVPIAPAELARYACTIEVSPGKVQFAVDGDHLSAVYLEDGKELGRTSLVHVGADTFETDDRLTHVRYVMERGRPALIALQADELTTFARP